MEIIEDYPPNYEDITKVFDLTGHKPIFTWGDKIYNPYKATIIPDLIIHEEVHEKQQGDDPKAWWDRFLTDSEFRLSQEVEAFVYQYHFLKGKLKAKLSKRFLEHFATLLSSQMYGNLLTKPEAETRIRNGYKVLVDVSVDNSKK